tara:strand:+ start:657 stop:1226 length:570 start_codon:yes stop_codon:yes gene_type:complete
MNIDALPVGHAFLTFVSENKMVTGLKCKDLGIGELFPFFMVARYFYMDPERKVLPIDQLMSCPSGMIPSQPVDNGKVWIPYKIEDIQPGFVCRIPNYQDNNNIMLTDKRTSAGQIVASIDKVATLKYDTLIKDLGPAAEYNGITKNHLTICPNCLRVSLKKCIVKSTITAECDFCGSSIVMDSFPQGSE